MLCYKRYDCDREELSPILTHWHAFHISGVAALAKKPQKRRINFHAVKCAGVMTD
jgi:hypothetical protein